MKVSWSSSLQVISNVAILIGLILVVWELQQTRILTRAQIASDGMGYRIESYSSLIESSPEVLAKACIEPENLNDSEKMQLSLINDQRLEIAGRVAGIEDFSSIGLDREFALTVAFQRNFQNQYGRDYYQRIRNTYPEVWTNIADELLSNIGPVQCVFM